MADEGARLREDPALSAVTGAHLTRALDDLLDSAQQVTRTLLGVGVDPADLPAGGALHAGPGPFLGPGMAASMTMAQRQKILRRTGRLSAS